MFIQFVWSLYRLQTADVHVLVRSLRRSMSSKFYMTVCHYIFGLEDEIYF